MKPESPCEIIQPHAIPSFLENLENNFADFLTKKKGIPRCETDQWHSADALT